MNKQSKPFNRNYPEEPAQSWEEFERNWEADSHQDGRTAKQS